MPSHACRQHVGISPLREINPRVTPRGSVARRRRRHARRHARRSHACRARARARARGPLPRGRMGDDARPIDSRRTRGTASDYRVGRASALSCPSAVRISPRNWHTTADADARSPGRDSRRTGPRGRADGSVVARVRVRGVVGVDDRPAWTRYRAAKTRVKTAVVHGAARERHTGIYY